MNAPVLLAHADAPRDQFLAARLPGVAASEIVAVMGLPGAYESAFALWHRKHGDLPDEDDNDAMRWGRRLEAAIADEFADRHPEYVIQRAGTYRHADRPWQIATPDRLVVDDELTTVACLECKTSATLDGWGEHGTDEIPVAYRAQALWQLDVTGLDVTHVALLAAGHDYREYVIERDGNDLELMREAALAFLASIDAGVAPPIDGHPSTGRALRALHPDIEDRGVEIGAGLRRSYRAANQASRKAEDRLETVKNRVLAAIGNGHYAVHDGRKVATRSVFDTNRLDTKRLRADHPVLAREYTKTSTTHKLIPAKDLI